MTNRTEYTEWTCSQCSSVATTIREGSAVCRLHAAQPWKAGRKWRLLRTIRTVIAAVLPA